MGRHYQVLISAPSKEQADKVLDVLLQEKIISGGLITHGPSRYWWKGAIEEQEYYNISAFIPESKKEMLVEEVRKISHDEVPIVAFLPIEGNQDFLEWIDASVD